jgi:hypothetical protein
MVSEVSWLTMFSYLVFKLTFFHHRCDVHSDDLDNIGEPRTRAADFRLYLAYREDHVHLWNTYGIIGGVVVRISRISVHIIY